MDESVAVLGHEVRNLLATFVGFTELLLSHDLPREQQLDYLQTMRDEGLRVSRFLQQLVDLERLEADDFRQTLQPRATDVGALLTYAAMLSAHDPMHPVVLDCPPGLPAAMAEPDRIQQVLANLLSNARKYSPQGGQIRLAARVTGPTLEVTVEDSGVGIPPDALARVFDKFYRVSSPRHKVIPGTGIGLAISREIVHAHGGQIRVESDGLDRGARFVFSLPLARVGRPRTRVVARDPRRSARGEHVLTHQGDPHHARGVPRPAAPQSRRMREAPLY